MTKNKFQFCLIFLVFCSVALAQESGPQFPHIFYGSSKINGIDTPAGTVIIAKVDGIEKGRITTTEAGKYGGQSANQDKLLVQGNIEEDAAIEFYISGVKANEVHSFESGNVAEKSLTWAFPSTVEIVQAPIINEPITCMPETTIVVSIPDLELDINCDTPTVGTLNNITDLGGTYFVSTPGAAVSNSIEISVSGDFDVVATMSYDDAGIDESTIAVYKYVNGSWVAIPSSDIISVDTVNNKIIFRVSPGTPHAGFAQAAPAPAAPTGGSGGGSVEVTPATTTTITPEPTPKTDVTTTTTATTLPQTTTTLPEETATLPTITPATAEPGNLITGFVALASSPISLGIGIVAIGAALTLYIKRKRETAKKQNYPATGDLNPLREI